MYYFHVAIIKSSGHSKLHVLSHTLPPSLVPLPSVVSPSLSPSVTTLPPSNSSSSGRSPRPPMSTGPQWGFFPLLAVVSFVSHPPLHSTPLFSASSLSVLLMSVSVFPCIPSSSLHSVAFWVSSHHSMLCFFVIRTGECLYLSPSIYSDVTSTCKLCVYQFLSSQSLPPSSKHTASSIPPVSIPTILRSSSSPLYSLFRRRGYLPRPSLSNRRFSAVLCGFGGQHAAVPPIQTGMAARGGKTD